MLALMLAAEVGERLGGGALQPPKVLLRFGGEWAGFLRLAPTEAKRLVGAMARYLGAGRTDVWCEAPIRDLLLTSAPDLFGWEEAAGLPWIEIEFPEDVARAEAEILPRLTALPARCFERAP